MRIHEEVVAARSVHIAPDVVERAIDADIGIAPWDVDVHLLSWARGLYMDGRHIGRMEKYILI